MPKVKTIERRISDVEGFEVRIRRPDGGDLRADYRGLQQQYPYNRKAWNDKTVSSWKSSRFLANYPGYDVDVLDCDGNSRFGHTRLGTIRATYLN